MYGIATDHCLE